MSARDGVTAATVRLGRLVMTQGVRRLVQSGEIDPQDYLWRHMRGDWGELCAEDKEFNDRACHDGDRIMSSYPLPAGVVGGLYGNDRKLWIVTEADRSVTTLLLPSEY